MMLLIHRFLVTALLLVAATAASGADAPEPVRTPFLMIDTEMHVGPVTRVTSDAAGTLIATGSTDKSVRLFAAADGRLQRKVHLPLGEDRIGAITGLALSPDGRRLIAATTSFDTGASFPAGSVYAVDVESGQLLGRMKNLPAPPLQLAFAPDGRYMAFALGERGLQVRGADYKEMLSDFRRSVVAIAFGPELLATVSKDAELRLFRIGDGGVTPLDEIRIRDAGRPYGLALSPDGLRAAIGYDDRPFVDVIDLRNKRKERLRAPPGASGGNLGAVAWTATDGSPWLVAGGTVHDPDRRLLLVAWRDGAGTPVSVAVSRDSITDLVPAGQGAVAFASADPAWGRVVVAPESGRLEVAAERHGERLDFRGVGGRGFSVDGSGEAVLFADRDSQRPSFRFDLATLELAEVEEAALAAAKAALPPVPLAGGWHLATDLAVKGRAVPLSPDERVLSAAASPDRSRLILGTDYRLRLIGADGEELASRPLTTAAWGVAVARDRPIAVAAHGDGTIRWYSLREDLPLAELAGLFVHADGQRWVAWTADGLFAHSDLGGEQLVGYQQNGTVKAPTGIWLGLEQVYRLFHDPNAVRRVLSDETGWTAIASRRRIQDLFAGLVLPSLALETYCPLAKLPDGGDPTTRELVGGSGVVLTGGGQDACACLAADKLDVVGRALAPGAGKDTAAGTASGTCVRSVATDTRHGRLDLPPGTRAVRIRLSVEDKGGGLDAVDAFVAGRNLGRMVPVSSAEGTAGRVVLERVVPVMAETTEVAFRAYNKTGIYAASPPLTLHVAQGVVQPPQGRPVLHVMAVGIDEYDGIDDLRLAVDDAATFVETVRKTMPKTYDKIDVVELYDGAATREAVIRALTDLAGRVQPQDAVLIYLAGHGVAQDGRYVFVTSNVTSAESVLADGLDHAILLRLLSDIKASNMFVLLDTCYSGAFDLKGPANFAHESGYFVLAAATSLQTALDSYDDINGVFAHAVQQGMQGAAAVEDSEVDALQLGVYVRKAVPKLTAEVKARYPNEQEFQSFQQSAVFKAGGGELREFPVAEIQR